MKAVVIEEFGGPEVLHVAEVPLPEPAAGQIRVQVKAAAVNPFDGKIRSGAIEAFFKTPLPAILGIELAGIVDAVGEGVTKVAVGDRVFGWADKPPGSYAEFALSSAYGIVPDTLEFASAVTLPVAVETSQRALKLLDLKPGETLLIHGASGAVGQVATQFAVAQGVRVIGTASPDNQELVRSLGAIATAYGDGLVERVRSLAPEGVDAVLDAAGKGALPDSIELRGGTDRIVTIADPAARDLGVTMSSGGDNSGVDLDRVARMLADGELRTTIGAVLPFEEAPKAHELVDSGHSGGKVVLTP
jgi:NADPH:quinone reductase-like Zn-dependent oxidoreductase